MFIQNIVIFLKAHTSFQPRRPSSYPQEYQISSIKRVLNFTAKLLSRAGRTLHDVQSHLDREGASDLVVELVIKSVHSPSIFVEAVELGSALLEGGNPIIQKSMYNKLMGGDLSQAFFKVRLQFVL